MLRLDWGWMKLNAVMFCCHSHARWALAGLLCMPLFAHGQGAARPKKVLTPAQIAYQAANTKWIDAYDGLRKKAQDAYAAEMARAKAGDCPDAETTLAREECLSKEMTTTQTNFAVVVGALRAMLGLVHPTMPGEGPGPGAEGMTLSEEERVAEFDRVEAASAVYRKVAAQASFDAYKGGTLAPVVEAETKQKLVQMHLEELAFVYETEFSNR